MDGEEAPHPDTDWLRSSLVMPVSEGHSIRLYSEAEAAGSKGSSQLLIAIYTYIYKKNFIS